eukprot:5779340-Alexandrium_andersonii.AAC.1
MAAGPSPAVLASSSPSVASSARRRLRSAPGAASMSTSRLGSSPSTSTQKGSSSVGEAVGADREAS